MSGADVVLQFEAATQTFSSGASVGPLSFSVAAGEVLGLIGANGSGKTTVMRMATGLCRLTSGRVWVNSELVQFGRLPAGCTALIEAPSFFRGLSGTDNLRLAASGRGERLESIPNALGLAGLDPYDHRKVGEYSQGMRQRLGIARLLLARNQILFLDEPTNGLDPDGFAWLRSLVRDLSEQDVCVLISSHILPELESVATRALVMRSGAVVAGGEMEYLLNRYSSLEQLYFDVPSAAT